MAAIRFLISCDDAEERGTDNAWYDYEKRSIGEILDWQYSYPQEKRADKYKYGINIYPKFSFSTIDFPFGLVMLTITQKYDGGVQYAYLDESVMSDRRGKRLLSKLSKKYNVHLTSVDSHVEVQIQ